MNKILRLTAGGFFGENMGNILYELNFNIAEFLLFLIPIIIGIVFIVHKKLPHPGFKPIPKALSVIISITGACVFAFGIFCAVGYALEYKQYNDCLKNGQYEIVEGTVEEFTALNNNEQREVHFVIDDVYFEYNNFEITNGYHSTSKNENIIKGNAQNLKIKYIDNERRNIILYIEEIE